MYKSCECGHEEFYTTKTVFHDITIYINHNGELRDGDVWEKSKFQPDEPYGMVVCKNCNKTYKLDELLMRK